MTFFPILSKFSFYSFIIGKNGCHIKDITNKIKNGAYVEYQIDDHKFIISAYSKDSLMKLTKITIGKKKIKLTLRRIIKIIVRMDVYAKENKIYFRLVTNKMKKDT